MDIKNDHPNVRTAIEQILSINDSISTVYKQKKNL